MKTLIKLIGIVCLSYSLLHAGTYLVALQANNGMYFCAENGGGGDLNANRTAFGPWETFIMEDLWAGSATIDNGDPIGIRAQSTNKYWCTDPRTLGVSVNRDVRGAWETFINLGYVQTGYWIRFLAQGVGPNCYIYARYGGGDGVKWGSFEGSAAVCYFKVTILAYDPLPAP